MKPADRAWHLRAEERTKRERRLLLSAMQRQLRGSGLGFGGCAHSANMPFAGATGGDVQACIAVYHLELRQFPHNACRFNLTEQELRPIVEPWVRERFVELEGRKWSPQQARLTILEGPRLGAEQLTMGRGWRAAQRASEDVTERILAAASTAMDAATRAPSGSSGGSAPGVDQLAVGVQLASLLGDDPSRLLSAWQEAATASPELSPSQSLASAEQALGSSSRAPG